MKTYFSSSITDKDRALFETYSEIKGLRLMERAKDKALTEVVSQTANCSICHMLLMTAELNYFTYYQ